MFHLYSLQHHQRSRHTCAAVTRTRHTVAYQQSVPSGRLRSQVYPATRLLPSTSVPGLLPPLLAARGFGAEAESGVLYARPAHNRHAQQPNNYCTFFLHSRHNLRSSLSLHSLHSMSTSPKPCTSDRWRRPADEGSSLDGCSGLPAPVPKITGSFRIAPHTAETLESQTSHRRILPLEGNRRP